MIKRILKAIFSIFYRRPQVILPDEKLMDLVPGDEMQKEVAWFTRKNNLVQEFAYQPIPVYSSDLSSNQIVGYLDSDGKLFKTEELAQASEEAKPTIKVYYCGYVVTAFNEAELAYKKSLIDKGENPGCYTVEEEFARRKMEEEGTIADDWADIYDKPNIEVKPKNLPSEEFLKVFSELKTIEDERKD